MGASCVDELDILSGETPGRMAAASLSAVADLCRLFDNCRLDAEQIICGIGKTEKSVFLFLHE